AVVFWRPFRRNTASIGASAIFWEADRAVFPKERHRPVDERSGELAHIERVVPDASAELGPICSEDAVVFPIELLS
ncbi:MAG: hypothetical protein RMM10_09105, partial [Anaerolineae bacterium]|nr:hypothetical protein [Thermoflexus sp.]MDW8181120.1 hypothetical protein [Anaerolineae bacterium]